MSSFTYLVIDPQWAVPLNTGLLVILAIVNAYRNKKTNQRVDLISQHAADAKNKCGANKRDEDRELIENVKEHLTTEPPPARVPKRFTDE